MRKTLLILVLTFTASLSTSAKSQEQTQKEANLSALESYNEIYLKQIEKQLKNPESGFNQQYQVANGEDSLFARATKDDINFYASLCAIAYTSERNYFILFPKK